PSDSKGLQNTTYGRTIRVVIAGAGCGFLFPSSPIGIPAASSRVTVTATSVSHCRLPATIQEFSMRDNIRHWACLIVLFVSLSSLSSAQTAADMRELVKGKPIERALAGGEVHAYSIQLTAGQFVSVIVDQRGVDLVVMAYAPDGKRVARVDGPSGAKGPEKVLLVAETSGAYRLELRSVYEMADGGRYSGRYE